MSDKPKLDSTFTVVNGAAAETVPVGDRGLLLGDSIFTTMKVQAGKIELLSRHLARLIRDAKALKFPAFEKTQILSDLSALPIGQVQSGALRYTITRGLGPRGYQIPSPTKPCRIVQMFAATPRSIPAEGIKLRVCATRLAHQPALAGLKHGNRLEQILARSEWTDDECFEGLMLDEHNHVVEGTCSNFFLIDKQRVLTPKLNRCGVKGVMRDLVMQQLKAMGVSVEETLIDIKDVTNSEGNARSGFICNALMGVVSIAQVENNPWQLAPVFSELKNQIDSELQKSLSLP